MKIYMNWHRHDFQSCLKYEYHSTNRYAHTFANCTENGPKQASTN